MEIRGREFLVKCYFLIYRIAFDRNLIFHGVNAVYKIAPWHPSTTGFDPLSSLSDIDAANLKSWGFNIVRLGVMWPGKFPICKLA
jgi:hypothetical protein